MKILFAGDTHGNLGHANYLVRMAKKEGCDRVFVLGDFGMWEHQKAGVYFLDMLDEYCNTNNITMYFLDGNHDKTSLAVEMYSEDRDDENFMIVRPHIRYAWRGHRWTWDDVTFISLGGAYSVDKAYRLDLEARYPGKYGPESLWFPEEEMTDVDMAAILEDATKVDVMLAHDKPRCSDPRWNRKDIPDCWPNQDRLQRAVETLNPRFFLHGHLHFSYIETVQHSVIGLDEPGVMTVYALDCDPDAASSYGYSKDLSWAAVDTADLKEGRLYSDEPPADEPEGELVEVDDNF